MSAPRRLVRIVDVPPLRPGFAGAGHLAAPVVQADDFAATDPFILLMDDHLDMGSRQVGGAHPHAGFETVTLLLDGAIHDEDEGGHLQAGDVQWMTAGRGIVHGENVRADGKVRLLQLWLVLPRRDRWTAPRFQDLRGDRVPIRREPGVEARVYSGVSGALRSPIRNFVPVTIVEARLEPGASLEQTLPASYNGFLFVMDGSIAVGADGNGIVRSGQVGWLDAPAADGAGETRVTMNAGDAGARVLLYAGEPQRDRIVSHGPFIGDSEADIRRLYAEYRAGQFIRMSELAAPARRAGQLEGGAGTTSDDQRPAAGS